MCETAELLIESRRPRLATWALSLAWIVNAALLFAGFVWTYFDGRSLQSLNWLQTRRLFFLPHPVEMPDSTARTTATLEAMAIIGISVIVGTLLSMLVGLFVGPRRFRSMRAWLVFMAITGGWLGFIMGWPEVHWRGQQRRMKAVIAHVEPTARYLDANWPKEDGDLPGIGPYLAYPKGGPTSVMPLKWVTIPETVVRFTAIERTNDGAMRFELSGGETGAWLEWRPDGREPTSFVSGLDSTYTIVRQQQLAPNWFLVRYRARHQVFFQY